MSGRETIHTTAAPAAIGPYAQAVAAGPYVFMSGQIGLDPVSGQLVEGGVEAQTRQVLANIAAVLAAAGLAFADVVKTTIFLTNMADFAAINTVYGESFEGGPVPARSTVAAAALPRGALVEIEVIALRRLELYGAV
jgi:2-iminobutanoate/2-iminopropanoate deaminase